MISKKAETIEVKPLINLYLIKEFMKKQKIKKIEFEINWFGEEKLSVTEIKEK